VPVRSPVSAVYVTVRTPRSAHLTLRYSLLYSLGPHTLTHVSLTRALQRDAKALALLTRILVHGGRGGDADGLGEPQPPLLPALLRAPPARQGRRRHHRLRRRRPQPSRLPHQMDQAGSWRAVLEDELVALLVEAFVVGEARETIAYVARVGDRRETSKKTFTRSALPPHALHARMMYHSDQ